MLLLNLLKKILLEENFSLSCSIIIIKDNEIKKNKVSYIIFLQIE